MRLFVNPSKRILVISYLFAPQNTPRAIRFGTLVDKWRESGAEVDVITYGPNMVESFESGRVFRVSSKLLSRLKKNDVQFSVQKDNASSASKSNAGFLKSILKRLWFSFAWPDGNSLWIFPALKKAKELIKDKTYDAVFTVAVPFSDHIVGLLLKGKNKWIADSGDPFSLSPQSPPNNYLLYKHLNVWAEKQVLRKCVFFTVTTEGSRQIYAHAFPFAKEKIKVIPPLYSGEMPVIADIEKKHSENNDIISIVFIGMLYKKMRNPDSALDFFVQLFQFYPGLKKRCRILFYGGLGDCQDIFESYRERLPLEYRGFLNHAAVLSAIRQSSILLNLGNATSFQTPSKIIEYALSGRPILNVAVIEHDSTAVLLDGDQTYMNVPAYRALNQDDFRIIADFIEKAPSSVRSADLMMHLFRNHSAGVVASKYLSL